MYKTIIITVIIFLIFFVSQNVTANTNYVSKTGAHISPFDSWVNAATNIQAAVDVAVSNDLVLVTNGVYDTGETVTPGYSYSNRVVITQHIVVASVNGPDNTIILGKGPSGESAVRGVYMSAGILSGFTISNGHTIPYWDNVYDKCGGGINMYGGTGMATNCIISGNSANREGGGIYYGKASNCTISDNSALNGGGTFESIINNCNVSRNSANDRGGGISYGIVDNCIISRNFADDYGGGIYYGTVDNCVIRENSTSSSGGGAAYTSVNNSIISQNSSGSGSGGGSYHGSVSNTTISGNSSKSFGGGASHSTVINCTINGNWSDRNGGGTSRGSVNNSTISDNTSKLSGGGVHGSEINNSTICGNSSNLSGGGIYDSSSVNNCTIVRNTADENGGGIDDCVVKNCIIWDNFAFSDSNYSGNFIKYTCSSPLPNGVGNFTNNPILLSASHISPLSPCIGAGTNVYVTGTDIDGEEWKNPPSVGCDEIYLNDLTGELEVEIYAKYTSAVVGSSLKFYSEIVGKPVSNHWTFGDAAAAAVADKYYINHFFSAAGNYEVILAAFNIDNTAGVSTTVTVNIVELNDATYYVNKANSMPVFPYQSWSTSATNIQDAVDAATQLKIKKSLVLVTNGIYNSGETVTPEYSSSNRVVITEDITVKSVNGPQNSVIVGKGPSGEDAVRGVYMSAGVLDGFTVSNGYTFSTGNLFYYDRNGGGVNLRGGNGSVTNCSIVNNSASYNGGGVNFGSVNTCTISDNSAGNRGGGLFNNIANNCTISRNTARYGGGAYEGTVNNCIISSNSVESFGGGTYNSTVNNCTVNGNSAISGGGVYVGTVNNSTISKNMARSGGGIRSCFANNCAISDNTADSGGGASGGVLNNCIISRNLAGSAGGIAGGVINNSIIIGNSATNSGGGATTYSTINNCTIVRNSANNHAGGTYQGTVNNCIIWDNSASISNNLYGGTIQYTCSYPLQLGEGNISNNPQFVSISNFHIQATSPCRNTGTNLPYVYTTSDLDGNPRIIGGRVDMGAYEFVPEPCYLLFIIYYLIFGFIMRKRER